MKNSYKLLLILFVVSVSFSCKKKDNTPEPTPNTNNPPTLVGASYSGLFSNELWTSIMGTSTFTVNYSQNMAYLSGSDFTNFNLPSGMFLNAGTISLNAVTFKNNNNYYTDSTNTPQQNPLVWQATGATLPAFTFTNTNSYPAFSGHNGWTDTISKSGGLNLSLTGMLNMDEALIYILNSAASGPAATGTLLASTTNFSFSPSSLSSLSTSTTAVIQIDIYRNNIQTINGKKLNFRNVATYVKTVQVKN